VTAHLAILVRQKHTHKPSKLARNDNVVGEPLFPNQTLTSLSLFAFTIAVLSLLGGLFEINPLWLYGTYEPYEVFAPAQPDWYMGWLEGLLRLWPAWEWTMFGLTIPSVFLPGVVVPGILFGVVYAWPWIDAKWIAKDHERAPPARPSPRRPGPDRVGGRRGDVPGDDHDRRLERRHRVGPRDGARHAHPAAADRHRRPPRPLFGYVAYRTASMLKRGEEDGPTPADLRAEGIRRVTVFHRYLGAAIVVLFLVIFLWGLVAARPATRRCAEPRCGPCSTGPRTSSSCRSSRG
jgi:hypothetical protein